MMLCASPSNEAIKASGLARTDFDLICSGNGEHVASHTAYGHEWDQK